MVGGFVGRELELGRVLRGCRGGGTVVLTGGAGVGKSRLVHEVAQHLADEGWRVESLTGSYGTSKIALGALASWLPTDPPASQALLLAHVLRALVGESGDVKPDQESRRVLVTADDAHLLDDASVDILSEAARRQNVTGLLSVRTPSELPPALHRLMSTDGVVVAPVGPLPARAVGTIATDMLGGSLSDDALSEVVDAVRGNPLYLRELLADALETGVFSRRDGRWHLDGDLRAGTRVSELIRARVRRLPPDLLTVLDMVAVAEPLPLPFVATDNGAVADLERHQLVRLESGVSGWTVTLDHPLVGEALRKSMTTVERLDVYDQLCRAVSAMDDRPAGVAARSMEWFGHLHSPVPADIAAEAAWEALTALDFDRAVDLADPASHLHWRAAFTMAEVSRAKGDLQASALWHDRSAGLASDDAAIRLVAMSRAALLAFHLSDPKAAIASLLDAATQVADDQNSLELQCEAAFHATLLGQFDDAVTTCADVLTHEDLDQLTMWTASINFAYAKVMLGDVVDLDAALTRARAAIDDIPRDHPAGADLHAALSVGSGMLNARVADAIAVGERAVSSLRADGSHRGLSAAVTTEALLVAADARAIDYALESVQQLRVYDPYNSLPYGLGFAALVAAIRGEFEDAQNFLDEAISDSADLRSHAVLGRARAALAAPTDCGSAAQIAGDVGTSVVDGQHVSFGIFCLYDALAYEPTADRAAVLGDVASISTSPCLRTVADCARAVAEGDPGRAIHAADRFELAGANGLAATALILAAGLEPDGVLACRLAARADAIALAAGWASPPWAPPNVDGLLTRREVEVAVAASRGHTDREIADGVFLATRTVGNHLHRAYGKLGIAGREDLGSIFTDRSADVR